MSLSLEDRNTLIQDHLYLPEVVARSICRKIPQATPCLQDLAQEGNLGLIRAARTYRAQGKAAFATYAFYWVKTFIQRALPKYLDPIGYSRLTPTNDDDRDSDPLLNVPDSSVGPEEALALESERAAVVRALRALRAALGRKGVRDADWLYRNLALDEPLSSIAVSAGVTKAAVSHQICRARPVLLKLLLAEGITGPG